MADILQEKAKVIEQKRNELASFLKANPLESIKGESGTSTITEFNKRNDELTTLVGDYNGLKAMHDTGIANDAALKEFDKPAADYAHPSGPDVLARTRKSFGQLFTESAAFKSKGAKASIADLSVKTLMQTTDGFAPEVVRNRPVLLAAQEPLNVLDLIPTRDVQQVAIKYMEETPKAVAASETNEGNTYAEADFDFIEKDSPVRKITVWIPVTDEQLEDEGYVRQYLNERMPRELRRRLAGQVVVGTGATVNGNATLRGMVNFAGSLTQAKGTDPVFDALLKGYTQIRTAAGGFSQPTATIINPVDETNIRLTRTADGRYILGDPGSQPMVVNIFGVPLVGVVQKPTGSSFTKDFSHLELFPYRGVDMQISNSHGTMFVEGKQAVRADIRVGFHDYRPASGCSTTGL